jgi:hypothetical protein
MSRSGSTHGTEERVHTKFRSKDPKRRNLTEDPEIDGKTKFWRVSRKYDVRVWTRGGSEKNRLTGIFSIDFSIHILISTCGKEMNARTFFYWLVTAAPAQNSSPVKSRYKDAPQLKRLVAGFPPRRPGFHPGSGQVAFVVDKVTLGQVFPEYFGFPCQSSLYQLTHNHPHLSSGAGTIGQKWPQCKGLSHPTSNKKSPSIKWNAFHAWGWTGGDCVWSATLRFPYANA